MSSIIIDNSLLLPGLKGWKLNGYNNDSRAQHSTRVEANRLDVDSLNQKISALLTHGAIAD